MYVQQIVCTTVCISELQRYYMWNETIHLNACVCMYVLYVCMYVCMYVCGVGDSGVYWHGIGRIFPSDVAMAPSIVHQEGLAEGMLILSIHFKSMYCMYVCM